MRPAIAALVALVLTAPAIADAAPSDVPLRDYIHTTWTHYDGVPLGMIDKILQTSDGYLWLFTRENLLRFDGMRFVPHPTPCTQRIQSQTAAVDGGFWAVCGAKLIRRTADARFVVVSATLPALPQHTLFADREGRLWILSSTIRYLNADGTVGRVFDSPRAELFFTATQDSEGTIWASDGNQVFQLTSDGVELVEALDGARCLIPARAGGILASSETGIWHLRKGARPSIDHVPGVERTATREGCIREANDGAVWMAATRGVVALMRAGRVETLADTGQKERLTRQLFIDREGAIWAGASSELHRFRKPTVQLMRWPAAFGQPWSVFVDSRANMWTGDSFGAHRWNLTDRTTHPVTPKNTYGAIGEDENGVVWLSNDKAIGYEANGKFVAVVDAMGKPVTNVNAFANDARGHLWALSLGTGVYRVTPGPPRLDIASPGAALRFLVSERTGVSLGLASGIEQHRNGRTQVFRRSSSDADLLTMLEDGDSIWVGSFAGLERLRNGTWTAWTREHGLPGDGSVKAMIADRTGFFWIMTGGGLLRVPRAQLDATPDGGPRPLSFARIGSLDGVVPHPGNLRSSPSVAADKNGRLYFTTVDTIAIVDPDAIGESSLAPPIVLESMIVDNDPVDLAAAGTFVEPSRLQFEYTSLTLLSPEYARFRYRLEGYDADWIEAGGERRVTYGTLRPGAYRFRVIGAGSEGVWNDTGASFAFRVVPVFWRTWWFRLSMLVVGLSIAGALYRLRVTQLKRQFNREADARVGERTRIARELHDTLLQSFQGVLIHFQAATNLLPERPEVARQRLEGVLEQAAQAVTEGRDAVQALRESAVPSEDLPQALGVLAEQLIRDAGTGAAIPVHIEGRPRGLDPMVRDHVYRIASEALRNAVRHAQAGLIQIDIHYGERLLQLRIRDDGMGISAAILEGRGASGHWGLAGMRERAELIGGTLDVRSRVGAGTEIELSLPASKAYAVTAGRRRFWQRSRQTETRS